MKLLSSIWHLIYSDSLGGYHYYSAVFAYVCLLYVVWQKIESEIYIQIIQKENVVYTGSKIIPKIHCLKVLIIGSCYKVFVLNYK